MTSSVEDLLLNPGPDGISLREAVQAANADPFEDTIGFSRALSGQTIEITGGVLDITTPLTIDARSLDDRVTIDARSASRVLRVGAGAGDVTLAGLTVTGGQAGRGSDGSGGSDGSPGQSGGGIASYSTGTLWVLESVITGNQAGTGGGVTGYGANGTILAVGGRGGDGGGVFAIGDLMLTSTTVSDNRAGEGGYGGINYSSYAFGGNAGPGGRGGGVFATGKLTITASTLSGNVAGRGGRGGDAFYSGGNGGDGGNGGGAFAEGALTVTQSTISGNATGQGGVGGDRLGDYPYGSGIGIGGFGGDGGGLSANAAPVAPEPGATPVAVNKVTGSTITGNVATSVGGLYAGSGGGVAAAEALALDHTIVAGNTVGAYGAGPDIYRTAGTVIVSGTRSLIGDATDSGLSEAPFGDAFGNLIGGPNNGPIDPLLSPLGENGGPTATHLLSAGSPAIEAGDPTRRFRATNYDQRGPNFFRVFTERVDIGATAYRPEFAAASLPTQLVVSTLLDEFDGDFGPGDLSLREAAVLANEYRPGPDTITFAQALDGETFVLTLGEIGFSEPTVLDATALPAGVTLDARQLSRVLNFVAPNGDHTLAGFRVTGGRVNGDNSFQGVDPNSFASNATSITESGGGIRSITSGTLTLDRMTVDGNSTLGEYASGGGVTSLGTLVLNNSTITGNRAASGGGGIDGFGTVTATGSTVSNNLIVSDANNGGFGGGIGAPEVVLIDSVVTGNRVEGGRSYGGGVNAQTVSLLRSEVSSNRAQGAESRGGGIRTYGRYYGDGLGDVVLTDSVVRDNQTSGNESPGGGVYAVGDIRVVDSRVVGNSTVGEESPGGGLATSPQTGGHIELIDSTLDGNSTAGGRSDGGGVWSPRGSVLLLRSTISRNQTNGDESRGAGLATRESALTLQNSTVSGNETLGDQSDGGGLAVLGTTSALVVPVTILNSTIADNHARADAMQGRTGSTGGGVWLGDTINSFALSSSIVATNTAGVGGANLHTEIDGILSGSSQNLVGPGEGFNTPLVGPTLGPLGDYGGPTETHALLSSSPAIDAGPVLGSSSGTDQRGEPFQRSVDSLGNGPLRDYGAFERQSVGGPTTYVVDTTLDEFDGDYSPGDLSLREAVALAGVNAGVADTIRFAPGLSGVIPLSLGEMVIDDPLAIIGPGDRSLVVDAQGSSRVFHVVFSAGEVSVSGLDLTRGRTTADNEPGGAIVSHTDGVLTLDNVQITASQTTGSASHGGAVWAAGPVQMTDVELSDNSTFGAMAEGGALATADRPAELVRSTVSGNETFGSFAHGGGIAARGDLSLIDSGVDTNIVRGYHSDGGGIYTRGNATLTGSQIELNSTLLDQSPGGGLFVGQTATLTDSLVEGNFTDGNFSGGGGIRAEEVVLVRTEVTGNSSAGENSGGGGLSAQTVEVTDSQIDGNTTTGDSSTGGGVRAGELVATDTLITGNSTSGYYYSGGGGVEATTVTLTGGTVTQNETSGSGSYGGGILASEVVITRVVVRDNRTLGPMSPGGGIKATEALIVESTISGNSMTDGIGGGGLYTVNEAKLIKSTVSGNTTLAGRGGGVHSQIAVVLDQATVTENRAPAGNAAGLYSYSDATFRNSVIAGNLDLDGAPTGAELSIGTGAFQANHTLVGASTGFFGTQLDDFNSGVGNVVSSLPVLGPLSNLGGPTPVHEPLEGGPLVDAGDPALVSGFDQRGTPFVRSSAGRADIGAVERQSASPTSVGDYNLDGVVNAIDYTLWRDLLAQSVPTGTAADGNGDGQIGPQDKAVWEANYGRIIGGSEPQSTIVVTDIAADSLFSYDVGGALLSSSTLDTENDGGRGVTTTPDGSLRFVVNGNRWVYRYDGAGAFLGRWRMLGVPTPEGITTDGTDLWVVSDNTDQVHYFPGGVALTDGEVAPASSFPLATGNDRPFGITTDGSSLWVVNDLLNQWKTFKYTVSGAPLGSWDLAPSNRNARGVTIDPANPTDLLVVNAGATNTILRYEDATGITSGALTATVDFELAAANTTPHGLTASLGTPAFARATASKPAAPRGETVPFVLPAGTNSSNPPRPSVVRSDTRAGLRGRLAEDVTRDRALLLDAALGESEPPVDSPSLASRSSDEYADTVTYHSLTDVVFGAFR